MRQFLYYLPCRDNMGTDLPPDLARCREHKIDHPFDRPPVTNRVMRAPDGSGQAGWMIGRDAAGLKLDPMSPSPMMSQSQVWRRVPGGDAWVGYKREDPPGPEDLARPEQLTGTLIELGDGKRWLVPVARQWLTDTNGDGVPRWVNQLPAVMDLSEAGNWQMGDVRRAYRPLFEASKRVWDAWSKMPFEGGGESAGNDDESAGVELELDDYAEICAMAIGTNYRIGAVECAMLGLLDIRVCYNVLAALIDYPQYLKWERELLKKKLTSEISSDSIPDPSSGGAGPAEPIPATSRP